MLVRVGWGHALETGCKIKEYHNILSNYQSTAVRWYHCPILYSRGSKAQIHSGLVQLKLYGKELTNCGTNIMISVTPLVWLLQLPNSKEKQCPIMVLSTMASYLGAFLDNSH